jgi:DNA-binding NtrC family response regulator
VSLFLPKHSDSALEAVNDVDETLTVLPAATAGRMLVADDEVAICRLIEKTFEADGWKVDTLHNYNDVLKSVVEEKTAYDLLILDVTMPGPSADESLETILKVHPGVPVLLISGFSRDERIENLVAQTHAEFLGKPFTTHDILSCVDKVLSGRITQ